MAANFALYLPTAETEAGEVEGKLKLVCVSSDPVAGTATGCKTEHAANPVLPDKAELIWGGLSFLIVIVVMVTKGVPAIQKAMQARTDRIKADLDAAEAAKVEQQAITAELAKQKADARAEYDRVVGAAREDAEAAKATILSAANAEAAEIKAKAATDAEAAKAQALTSVQSSIGDLVVELAGKVVERNLDPTSNKALVDSFITKVGS